MKNIAETLTGRVAALESLYQKVAATRMRGLGLLNPALRVEALGFMLAQEGDAAAGTTADAVAPAAAVGVLVTPWFMNLVWLPLVRLERPAWQGRKVLRRVGAAGLAFVDGHAEDLGSYAACSLFSPMFEFEDHATAVATAWSVLDRLRQAPDAAAALPPDAPAATRPAAPAEPARRAFLLGRRVVSPRMPVPAAAPAGAWHG